MDALTNVVAVLILVLVLVQAGVTRKVQSFLDDLPPATTEDVAASIQRIESLNLKLRLAQARLRETPPTPEAIEEEKREIALLEESMEENSALLADLAKLRELEKKIRAERDLESEKTVAIQKEIARLLALLDQTPVIEPDTPTVVTLPNSRPIPSDARIHYAIAWKDRIHMIDPVTPIELFNRELKRNGNNWIEKRVKKKGAPDVIFYDRKKIAAHFKNFNWRDTRGQKVELEMPPTAWRVQLVIRPDLEKGGTPVAELGKPDNDFAKAVVLLKQDFDSVVMFLVHPDSFNAYLDARELIDKVNIAAGWEMNWKPVYRTAIQEAPIRRTEAPPPAGKPKPPGPPPLKPKLD